ncbi:hypothetical protein LTR64_003092 [Lithohypha guttulata]|uniref:Zn(2)-C6 fungal-type domain-containing protein n=1 Tax=Lithohypha guttulata TaxID=1690604 RepID=A0AAN7T0W2_9EURO|nr:hypothetical protein LTR51_000686 [Lithohypha guttulata]KAK5085873.1 hypothetical protein LTR05_005162 [Lithohypha guttulata]
MRVHPDDRKKKHHAKSRHGCISCKKRHLKCDEARPECQRCIKDFGKCEGYRTPKAWLFESAQEDPGTVVYEISSNSPSSGSVTSVLRDRSSPISSQTSLSVRSSISSKHSTSPEPEHTRQKRWAPKSRSGCVTCKKRRIKCDEGRPACGRCTASSRKCEYTQPPLEDFAEDLPEEVQALELLQRKIDMFEDPDHPPTFKYVHSSPYKSQTEHQTFVHWQNRTESCQVISRSFGDFNILGCELPKAAWNYDCLKHGLLSAASVTASIERFSLGESNERQAVVEAVKQSSMAITSIFKEKPPPEVTVLVAFVFWFMEAWIGQWDRAVMHLASAARMCEQGFPNGQVSEAVAWYVTVCATGVPQALKSPDILKYVQDPDDNHDEKFQIRLLWGIREAVTGIRLLDQARAKALQVRPNDCSRFNIMLASHQAQMRFMSERWRQYAKLQLTKVGSEARIPPAPIVPTYDKVLEMIDYFIEDDEDYDALILAVRLKMIQRSLPLFVAGTNIEIRKDAALSIPIKVEAVETETRMISSDINFRARMNST